MEEQMKNILLRIEQGVRKSLEAHKLTLRNQRYLYATDEGKAKVIDEQITDILTRDAKLGDGEQK